MILRLILPFALATVLTSATEHAATAPSPASHDVASEHTAAPATNSPDHATPAPAEGAATSAAESLKLSPEAIAAAHGEAFGLNAPATVQPATPSEIDSLLRIGKSKIEQGDYVSSELAFRQVLAERGTPEQDHDALMGLARTYRKKTDFTKAAAVYEALIKQYPDDPLLPVVYLELGRTLRALGAYKPAIARFYSVINTTLKLPADNTDNYRQLARTAQFEIAETYFQAGDYTQANRYFSRLKLLDLAPEDRARAHFKSVFALTLAGEDEKAVSGFRAYLDQNPADENVPEARYLLSVSLRKLGRYNEALAAALDLLKAEQKNVQSDPKRWAYWQRKTGNQLANQFYEQGDFGSALLIYQSLANLSPEPSWRLPVTYQIGLCQERLYMYDRARECYQTIIDNTTPAATDSVRRADLADLADMAHWRLKHLDWEQKTDRQLSLLFPNKKDRPVALKSFSSSPDPDHDTAGSAPNASPTVR